MYTTIGTYYSFQMIVCCPGTVVPPDYGPRYARNTQSLTKYTKNKLCIELVFLYTILTLISMASESEDEST